MGTERADRLAGPSIPDLHGSILFPRDQVAAVGAERHGLVRHGPGRPGASKTSRPVRASQTLTVPQAVQADRGDALAVGVPGQTEDNQPCGH